MLTTYTRRTTLFLRLWGPDKITMHPVDEMPELIYGDDYDIDVD